LSCWPSFLRRAARAKAACSARLAAFLTLRMVVRIEVKVTCFGKLKSELEFVCRKANA
jgi:hypothetical protein